MNTLIENVEAWEYFSWFGWIGMVFIFLVAIGFVIALFKQPQTEIVIENNKCLPFPKKPRKGTIFFDPVATSKNIVNLAPGEGTKTKHEGVAYAISRSSMGTGHLDNNTWYYKKL